MSHHGNQAARFTTGSSLVSENRDAHAHACARTSAALTVMEWTHCGTEKPTFREVEEKWGTRLLMFLELRHLVVKQTSQS